MKTSELQGAALDWAVAKCEGLSELWLTPDEFNPQHEFGVYTYATNWAQGGPIIEREKIATLPCPRGWAARIGFGGEYIEGTTPLIAAMRCYVASKLGDEVEIPEDL